MSTWTLTFLLYGVENGLHVFASHEGLHAAEELTRLSQVVQRRVILNRLLVQGHQGLQGGDREIVICHFLLVVQDMIQNLLNVHLSNGLFGDITLFDLCKTFFDPLHCNSQLLHLARDSASKGLGLCV